MLSDIEDELRLEADTLRAMLERERRAREHRTDIQRLAAETSGQVSREGVADVLASGAQSIFDCRWVMVGFVVDDDMVQIVHGPEVPSDVAADWTDVPLSASVPITDMLRGDLATCELSDSSQFARWPALAAEASRSDIGSLFVLPITGSDRPAAVIAVAWPAAHELDDLERELIDELIDAATPAFNRAVSTEVDRDLAATLQNWLLPTTVPDIEALDIATLYEAGRREQEVGGDWYDVIRLDDHRSAIVVGDVVGHDARAAAEMGQVRHVLAAHLLTTGDPAASLHLADHYFHVRSTNTMATALVMVFDSRSHTVELASAGHLPPVIAELGASARLLESGLGPPIGSGLGGYQSLSRSFPPNALLVAFTDGVVELRDQSIDDSLEHFCRAVDQTIETAQGGNAQQIGVGLMLDMVAQRVADPERTDDAAAVICGSRPTT